MSETPLDSPHLSVSETLERGVRRVVDEAVEAGAEAGEITVRWRMQDSKLELTVLDPAPEVETTLASSQPAAFLLVEDHELSARALARWLRSYGTVVIATTLLGQETCLLESPSP